LPPAQFPIPRCAQDRLHPRALAQFPDKSVFSSTGTDYQYFHFASYRLQE
jgi:hypothetical protein